MKFMATILNERSKKKRQLFSFDEALIAKFFTLDVFDYNIK